MLIATEHYMVVLGQLPPAACQGSAVLQLQWHCSGSAVQRQCSVPGLAKILGAYYRVVNSDEENSSELSIRFNIFSLKTHRKSDKFAQKVSELIHLE